MSGETPISKNGHYSAIMALIWQLSKISSRLPTVVIGRKPWSTEFLAQSNTTFEKKTKQRACRYMKHLEIDFHVLVCMRVLNMDNA